jgi:hypothetical protein
MVKTVAAEIDFDMVAAGKQPLLFQLVDYLLISLADFFVSH